MLTVEWYYGDAGLDHTDGNILILTQLPQKSAMQQISELSLTPFLTRETPTKPRTIQYHNDRHADL